MLPTEYQQFIHLSRYARWDYDQGRRETWHETIERYFTFFTEHLEETCGFRLDNGERVDLENSVKELEVMNKTLSTELNEITEKHNKREKMYIKYGFIG